MDRRPRTRRTPPEPPAYDPRIPQWRARIENGDLWEQFTDPQAAEELGLARATARRRGPARQRMPWIVVLVSSESSHSSNVGPARVACELASILPSA